jgi:hypothetical protein
MHCGNDAARCPLCFETVQEMDKKERQREQKKKTIEMLVSTGRFTGIAAALCFLYFCAGAAYNRVRGGKRGCEACPHYGTCEACFARVLTRCGWTCVKYERLGTMPATAADDDDGGWSGEDDGESDGEDGSGMGANRRRGNRSGGGSGRTRGGRSGSRSGAPTSRIDIITEEEEEEDSFGSDSDGDGRLQVEMVAIGVGERGEGNERRTLEKKKKKKKAHTTRAGRDSNDGWDENPLSSSSAAAAAAAAESTANSHGRGHRDIRPGDLELEFSARGVAIEGGGSVEESVALREMREAMKECEDAMAAGGGEEGEYREYGEGEGGEGGGWLDGKFDDED